MEYNKDEFKRANVLIDVYETIKLTGDRTIDLQTLQGTLLKISPEILDIGLAEGWGKCLSLSSTSKSFTISGQYHVNKLVPLTDAEKRARLRRKVSLAEKARQKLEKQVAEGKAAEKKLLGMNNGNLQDSNREH